MTLLVEQDVSIGGSSSSTMNAEHARSLGGAIGVLRGEKLGPVTFAPDHWLLDFNGHQLTVMTYIRVKGRHWEVAAGEDFFRDRLCERIGKSVAEATMDEGTLTLAFEDGVAVAITLPLQQ